MRARQPREVPERGITVSFQNVMFVFEQYEFHVCL